MKPETILNAMVIAIQDYYKVKYDIPYLEKRLRQARAFRARILRMYRKRDEQAAKSFELWTTERGIANDLRRQLKEKDKRIAELESITYCAYCGKEYKVDDDAYEVGEHIQTCEKHPLFKANQRIAELERELEEMEVDLNTAEDLAIHGLEGI